MILLLILVILVFLFWFNRQKEGNCVLIFANIGAGKTTLLSRYAQKELRKIKKGKSAFKYIISNTPISGCIYVPSIRDMLKHSSPEETLILVDEAGIVWNNRKMRITDQEIEYLKMIRHYKSKLVAISQSFDDVDITIRRLYTNMYLLNKIGGITLVRPIKKFVKIDEETEQIIDGYCFKSLFSWGLLYRRLYYSYFDTFFKPNNDRVHPDYKPYEVVPYKNSKKYKIKKLFKKNPKKFTKLVDK